MEIKYVDKETISLPAIMQQKLSVFEPYKEEALSLAAAADGLVITDLDDKEQFDACHKARMNLKNFRVKTEKDEKLIRAEVNAALKQVGDVANEIYAITDPAEEKLSTEENKVVQYQKDKKEAKQKSKELRLQKMTDLLFEIGLTFNGLCYTDISVGITMSKFELEAISDEDFHTFCGNAIDMIQAEKQRIADKVLKEKAEQDERDRILKEQQDRIARQQEEIDRQKKAQEDAAKRITEEQAKITTDVNNLRYNRLIKAGALPENLAFDTLYLKTEEDMVNAELFFAKKKAKRDEISRQQNAERIKREEVFNNAAVLLHDGTGWPVLDCKNDLMLANPSDIDKYVSDKIVAENARKEAEKADMEALKSDKVKVVEYIKGINAIDAPVCKSKKWAGIIKLIVVEISKFENLCK